ncbi:DUF4345 domain-containing protein [Sphingobium sp. AS12]|uniref:DUF4345 domain-containing protein n=1 Tax=Sphingobium sp. AS12 TaxID=2849495 RepID=UPI001C31BC10|nr:DUF4345 domain-containing protein [Sphingobium sp. AS12]MBV2150115.1 DUF4345 domain-containing protein [Sphingobium sp. AS12]
MTAKAKANYLLRGAIALVGAVIVFLGLNVGLGGIPTLGWQGGSAPFFAITDTTIFAVRNSHVRFLGGVWFGVGQLMLAGSLAFQRLRTVLIALAAMIFVGGLARMSGYEPSVLFSPEIAPSLLFEIVIAPLLAFWFWKAERQPEAGKEMRP